MFFVDRGDSVMEYRGTYEPDELRQFWICCPSVEIKSYIYRLCSWEWRRRRLPAPRAAWRPLARRRRCRSLPLEATPSRPWPRWTTRTWTRSQGRTRSGTDSPQTGSRSTHPGSAVDNINCITSNFSSNVMTISTIVQPTLREVSQKRKLYLFYRLRKGEEGKMS